MRACSCSDIGGGGAGLLIQVAARMNPALNEHQSAIGAQPIKLGPTQDIGANGAPSVRTAPPDRVQPAGAGQVAPGGCAVAKIWVHSNQLRPAEAANVSLVALR
jgi:hypothetical protein